MSSSRKPILLAVFALLGAGLYFIFNGGVGDIGPTPPKPTPTNKADTRAPTDDPSPSFDLVCHTADTGGDERTRELAISWLDTQARERNTLSSEQTTWLLDTLHAGGHPEWKPGYRQWFYNSAFNALHRSEASQPLTRLLAGLAEKDPDPILRLYALQHIGTQRANGRLSGPLALEIHELLRRLLGTDPATSGTVIDLLATWDGEGNSSDPASRARAAAMAEDRALATDVRITALHTAGPESLAPARRLAVDTTQPVLLRKAAIACIGRHGTESDFADLKKLSSESSRLAQAAEPALSTIRHRISNPGAPEPIPF
jgi:hypothetical protein